MTKNQIIKALKALDKELQGLNVKGEISIVGGAVMCLAFNARNSTQDVDAIFKPTLLIQKAAFNVSEDLKLNNLWWLNDAVKEFISKKAVYDVKDFGFKNLIVRLASAEYMLAMKLLAARAGTNDETDVLFLVKFLKLKNQKQLEKIVKKYYPSQKLSIETKLLIKSVFG